MSNFELACSDDSNSLLKTLHTSPVKLDSHAGAYPGAAAPLPFTWHSATEGTAQSPQQSASAAKVAAPVSSMSRLLPAVAVDLANFVGMPAGNLLMSASNAVGGKVLAATMLLLTLSFEDVSTMCVVRLLTASDAVGGELQSRALELAITAVQGSIPFLTLMLAVVREGFCILPLLDAASVPKMGDMLLLLLIAAMFTLDWRRISFALLVAASAGN